MKKSTLFIISISAVILLLVSLTLGYFWQNPAATTPTPLQASPTTAVSQPKPATPHNHTALDLHTLQTLQKTSLAGTQIDGSLDVDSAGHFIFNANTVRWFEYFWTTYGELSQAQILTLLNSQIQQQLKQPAQGEAKRYIEKYLSYRQRIGQLQPSTQNHTNGVQASIEDFAIQLKMIHNLRVEIFGERIAKDIWGNDEAYDHYTLERMKVNQALGAIDPATQAKLAQQLPAQLQTTDARLDTNSQYAAQLAALKKQGATPSQIKALRVAMFGEAAALRFEKTDLEESAWKNKVTTYLDGRQAILSNNLISQAQKETQIEQLKNAFDTNEKRRLAAYEASPDLLNQ